MNIEITSRANPRLKELLAAKEKLFFFEGEKLVRDILARKLTVQKLLVSAEGTNACPGSRPRSKNAGRSAARCWKKYPT